MPKPETLRAYRLARRRLLRLESQMLAEGERLYLEYGAQRAMGFVDGYRTAMGYLVRVED